MLISLRVRGLRVGILSGLSVGHCQSKERRRKPVYVSLCR